MKNKNKPDFKLKHRINKKRHVTDVKKLLSW